MAPPTDPSDPRVLRYVALGHTGYKLLTWDTGRPCRPGASQWGVGYRFTSPACQEHADCLASTAVGRACLRARAGNDVALFEGEDFGCAPGTSIDSDECLRSILGFLTLRPGDTDPDYFADYTEAQRAFAEGDAEDLVCWSIDPDPNIEPMPLIDLLDDEAAA